MSCPIQSHPTPNHPQFPGQLSFPRSHHLPILIIMKNSIHIFLLHKIWIVFSNFFLFKRGGVAVSGNLRSRSTIPVSIYIIIWLSPYVLFVRSLSPPKLAGLAPPPNFRRHTLNWTWNIDSKKIWKKNFTENFQNFFFFAQIFFGQLFPWNRRARARSVAISELT
jgi:hypothetical protein